MRIHLERGSNALIQYIYCTLRVEMSIYKVLYVGEVFLWLFWAHVKICVSSNDECECSQGECQGRSPCRPILRDVRAQFRRNRSGQCRKKDQERHTKPCHVRVQPAFPKLNQTGLPLNAVILTGLFVGNAEKKILKSSEVQEVWWVWFPAEVINKVSRKKGSRHSFVQKEIYIYIKKTLLWWLFSWRNIQNHEQRRRAASCL